MRPALQASLQSPSRRRAGVVGLLAGVLVLLAACTGMPDVLSRTQATPPAEQPTAIGTGAVKVGLILPLSAGGNAGTVAQSMKNAAEMALAEFNSPNVQLLVKDDGGTSGGAQPGGAAGARRGRRDHHRAAVRAFGRRRRRRRPPARRAGDRVLDRRQRRGARRLSSELPAGIRRRPHRRLFAIANGKRSFAAMLSEGAYGNVVEAEFKQVVARKGARIVALERYALDPARCRPRREPSRRRRAGPTRCSFPRGRRWCPSVAQALIGGRPRHQTRPASRHRLVGRPAHLQRSAAARRLVCRARQHRLPQFLRPLSPALQPGPGAHGDAGL